ncbi:hypothetical protein VTG60DRAFT_877 [Thermothelomyces hinnuleus]
MFISLASFSLFYSCPSFFCIIYVFYFRAFRRVGVGFFYECWVGTHRGFRKHLGAAVPRRDRSVRSLCVVFSGHRAWAQISSAFRLHHSSARWMAAVTFIASFFFLSFFFSICSIFLFFCFTFPSYPPSVTSIPDRRHFPPLHLFAPDIDYGPRTLREAGTLR